MEQAADDRSVQRPPPSATSVAGISPLLLASSRALCVSTIALTAVWLWHGSLARGLCSGNVAPPHKPPAAWCVSVMTPDLWSGHDAAAVWLTDAPCPVYKPRCRCRAVWGFPGPEERQDSICGRRIH